MRDDAVLRRALPLGRDFSVVLIASSDHKNSYAVIFPSVFFLNVVRFNVVI